MQRYDLVGDPYDRYIDKVDDGDYIQYSDIKNLLDAVYEVCSWDWNYIFDEKYIEEELLKDLTKLNREFSKIKKDEAILKKDDTIITLTLSEVLSRCSNWTTFCKEQGWSEWCVNEGGGDVEIKLSIEKAKRYGLI